MNKLKLLGVMGALVLVASCGGNKDPEKELVIETQKVKEPVPVWSGLPKFQFENEYPKLPINKIDENSSDKETAEAYAKSIKILQNELKYRTFLLQSYNVNK